MRVARYARHIPGTRIAVEDCIAAAHHHPSEAKAFKRIFGLSQVAAYPKDEPVSVSITAALDLLEGQIGEAVTLPDAFILVHANPVQTPAGSPMVDHLAATHPFLALVDQAYEMDQNCCSTLFWALAAAQNMLAKGAARSVAIVAGDSFANLPIGARYIPACTVLGDAYVALLLDGASGGLQIDDIVTQSHPEFHFGLYGTAEEVHHFNRAHTPLLESLLARLNFPQGEDEPILPHNVNRFSWDQFCATTGTALQSVWLNLVAELGHCCTTDAFLNLEQFASAPEHSSAVLVSVGQGGFVGACRVRKSSAEAAHAVG